MGRSVRAVVTVTHYAVEQHQAYLDFRGQLPAHIDEPGLANPTGQIVSQLKSSLCVIARGVSRVTSSPGTNQNKI